MTVMLSGQTILGASLSSTMTLNEHVDLFPDASCANTFTLVEPIGKVYPGGGVMVKDTPGALSVTGTLNGTLTEDFPGGAVTVISPGQLIVGGSLSTTTTLKLQLATMLPESIAVFVTKVEPIGNTEPEGFEDMIVISGQSVESFGGG